MGASPANACLSLCLFGCGDSPLPHRDRESSSGRERRRAFQSLFATAGLSTAAPARQQQAPGAAAGLDGGGAAAEAGATEPERVPQSSGWWYAGPLNPAALREVAKSLQVGSSLLELAPLCPSIGCSSGPCQKRAGGHALHFALDACPAQRASGRRARHRGLRRSGEPARSQQCASAPPRTVCPSAARAGVAWRRPPCVVHPRRCPCTIALMALMALRP
jgi:hypothetical protein